MTVPAHKQEIEEPAMGNPAEYNLVNKAQGEAPLNETEVEETFTSHDLLKPTDLEDRDCRIGCQTLPLGLMTNLIKAPKV